MNTLYYINYSRARNIGVSRKFAFEISRPLVHSTNVEDGQHKLRCISEAQYFRIVCYRLIIIRKLLFSRNLKLVQWIRLVYFSGPLMAFRARGFYFLGPRFFYTAELSCGSFVQILDKSVKKRGILKIVHELQNLNFSLLIPQIFVPLVF